MRIVTKTTLIVFVALLVDNPCLYPVNIPQLDLPTLVKDATNILVADVLACNTTGREILMKLPRDPSASMPATELVADVRVIQLIKGELPTKSIQIYFYLPRLFMGYREIPSGQKGLLFLRKREDGKYSLIDPYHPMLVAGGLAAKSDASVLDQVLDVMALAVLDPELSTSDRRAASASLDQVDSPNLVEILHNRIKQADFVGQVLISKILIT